MAWPPFTCWIVRSPVMKKPPSARWCSGGGGVKETCFETQATGAQHPRGVPDGGGERHGEIPLGDDAVAGVVEPVLAAPGPQDHLRVIEEVAIDRDRHAGARQVAGVEPRGVDVAWRFAGAASLQEHDIRHDAGTFPLEGIRRGGEWRRRKSVCSARYSRTAAFCLSSVKVVVPARGHRRVSVHRWTSQRRSRGATGEGRDARA